MFSDEFWQWLGEKLAEAVDEIYEMISDMAEAPEPEENKPRTPCRIFFVRTVSGHLIPWYTSGFQ